ncbi:hypothetical protein E4U61_006311 [Claviceps capensis]|nr:hypothetical protein E4U61_006311 [Claviceps capensis]
MALQGTLEAYGLPLSPSPTNGLNIPNDLGEAKVLCSAPRASTPAPWPFSCDSHTRSWPTPREPTGHGTEGHIFGEPTTLEKPASRVASQQLLKEATAPKDVSSEKSTTPEELTTSRIGVQCLQVERVCAWSSDMCTAV